MMNDLSTALFCAGILALFFGMFALPFALVMVSNDRERRERARLRTEGVRGEALVKSFRRVSQTQHRVLVEARLPSGPVGRELLVSGLADDWLAHHAALGIPVAVFANASGSTIVLDQPEDGPTPTTSDTTTRVLLLLGGVLLGSLVLGAGFAIVQGRLARDRDEALTAPEVRRLRDAFTAAGIEVERMSPRSSKSTGVQQHVSFEFASGVACTVAVRASDARVQQPATARPPIQNGRLVLSCDETSSKDLPRIQATFRAFRP
ncbi:MAG: hypothetical protein QM820_10740 [Minicystis sp.]